MPYVSLYEICPELARKETRVITILDNDNDYLAPKGDYIFLELYCDECDCRRVFLQVFDNNRIVCSIAFGWEQKSFYRKAFKGFSEKDITEIKGPFLDNFQPQSEISNQVFKMFMKLLYTDKDYLDRLPRHYKEFKKSLRKSRF